MKPEAHPRSLGLTTATMLVVASMIGTGIFTTTGFLLKELQSGPAVLAAWGLGGLAALCGALAYTELVTALPQNGGEYQLLSRIFHPAVGFTAGAASLVVGFAGPVAAAAIAFGDYMNVALGTAIPVAMSALVLVVGVSVLHATRVSLGGGFQNVFTVGKVILIGAFLVAGVIAGDVGRVTAPAEVQLGAAVVAPGFAVGLIYVAYAYTGWNAAIYVAGELERPARDLPVALLVGTGLVMALYLGLNVVFLAAAPAEQIANAGEGVAHVAAIALFGETAGRALAGLIAVGLVSMVGALAMTGPRIYEAMGRDYPRLGFLAHRPKRGGPVGAIAIQGALAAVMIVTATFEDLLAYSGFTMVLFGGMTVLGLFVLRAREPDLPRPYRAWGHPVTTGLFLVVALWMVAFAIWEKPIVALAGGATLGACFVLYLWAKPRVDE